jgi:hypothetical protein
MNKFKLDNRTLRLLSAQVNLSETFIHKLRSTPPRVVLSLSLKVERSKSDTLFTIVLGGERHTLTLQNAPKMHLKLADIIEEIASGPVDSTSTAELLPPPHPIRRYAAFDAEHIQQVFELVRTGGALSLDLGFELPIQIAIHRNQTRTGVTTIMSIGVKRPRTKCFTVCGTEVEMYEKVIESINHLAAVVTSAAHAA